MERDVLREPFQDDQLFQARLKAHEYVASSFKYLMLVAAGAIVLSGWLLHTGPGVPNGVTLSSMYLIVVVAWCLLFASIFNCIIGIGHMAKGLDVPDTEAGISGLSRAFLAGNRFVIGSARVALGTCVGGVALLLISIAAKLPAFF